MTASQQDRPKTPDENFRELYKRVAKLNDAVSALLSPAWGSESGIIPADHPLYVSEEPPEADACRPVEIDGETIRVHGAAELSDEGTAALRDVMRAARRRLISEQRAAMAKYPYENGDTTVLGPEIFADADGKVICWKGENYVPQNRLRLAHAARRVKEGQLDGIRRALCDVGLMEDDDPYGHADLEDVIRQALRPACPDPIECGHEAALGLAEEKLARVREIANTWMHEGEPGPTQTAGRCLLRALGEPAVPATTREEQP